MLVRSEMLIYKGSVTVFPTHVGVIPVWVQPSVPKTSIPHTRGGDPYGTGSGDTAFLYSPHTWG